jgi:hypothetical protein
MGNGLKMLCKLYGGLRVTGPKGKIVEYIWDYKNDCAVNVDEIKQRVKDVKKAKADKRAKDTADMKRVVTEMKL